jgi:hypothetical protein
LRGTFGARADLCDPMHGVYRCEFPFRAPKQFHCLLEMPGAKRTFGLDLKRAGCDERKWNDGYGAAPWRRLAS